MSQPNKPTKSLSDIASEFAHDILPAELQDILEGVRTVKRGSGWGKMNLTFLNNDLDSMEVTISKKRKKDKPG